MELNKPVHNCYVIISFLLDFYSGSYQFVIQFMSFMILNILIIILMNTNNATSFLSL